PKGTSAGHLEQPVGRVVFSPDGTLLAAATRPHRVKPVKPDSPNNGWQAGKIELWKVASLDPLGPPGEGHMGAERNRGLNPGLAFSPDGKTLASGGGIEPDSEGDGHCSGFEVALWDVDTFPGRYRRASPYYRRPGTSGSAAICSLAFSPDGKTLAAGCAQVAVAVMDVDRLDGLPRLLWNSPPFTGHSAAVNNVAFS